MTDLRETGPSPEVFRALIENSRDLVSILGPDGSLRYVSPSLREVLGFQPEEKMRASALDEVHPDDRPRVERAFQEILAEPGATRRLEYRVAHRDGTWRTLDTIAENRLEDETIEGVVVHSWDVTRRRRMEREFREQAVDLRQRVKELGCLYEVDRALSEGRNGWDTGLQDVVDAIPAGFRYPDRVAARLRVWDRTWVSSGYVETRWSLASPVHVAEREVGELDVRFVEDPPEGLGTAFIEEERRLLDSIAERIGEAVGRRRAERDLRKSEAHYRDLADRFRFQADLLDAVGQAVVATDLEGRILYWNRAAEDLYGWGAEEVTGLDVMEITPSHRSLEEAEGIMDRLRRGETWSGEFEVRRKDGSSFTAFVTNAPIEDADGHLVGIIGVSTDLTDRIELEQRLRQAERMEAIGRLAGGVAHDFNNLLTVIRGHSEVVLQDLPDDSPLREDVRAVLDVSRRAADLVAQLLAFGRRQILDERVLDLRREISEMKPMLRRLMSASIDLRFDLGEEPRPVRIDPGQLHQVVLNLTVNAVDAIEAAGSVDVVLEEVEVSEQQARAFPSGARPGPFVRLTVRDTGVGISSETMDRIFEPFFTTKPGEKGTGLGLATVFGIVSQTGGHVEVDSELGEGTTFRVLLPKAEEGLEEGAGTLEKAAPGAGGGETVLLVEDEEAVRDLIRRVLERAGYEVRVAERGERAVEILEDDPRRIDLVVSDVVMPGMGGRALIERFRELRSDLPVVLISGYSPEEVIEGAHHEASAFLAKPFSPEEITRVVREALDRRD